VEGFNAHKNVDNQKYIFVPTFVVLKFNTNLFFTQMEKNILGRDERKGRVGSPEPNIFFLFALHRLKYQNIFISNRKQKLNKDIKCLKNKVFDAQMCFRFFIRIHKIFFQDNLFRQNLLNEYRLYSPSVQKMVPT